MSAPSIAVSKSPERSALAVANQYFYLAMALVGSAAVIYGFGFGHTSGPKFLENRPSRPAIVAIHTVVFSSWMLALIVQSALVNSKNVRLHMKLGMIGGAFGVLIPIIGIVTAVITDRLNWATYHDAGAAPFFAIQFGTVATFTVLFWIAMANRRNRESHRRLIMAATFALLPPAFARFPQLHSNTLGFACADFLLVISVARDWIAEGKLYGAYLYPLASFVLVHPFLLHYGLGGSPGWTAFAARFLR